MITNITLKNFKLHENTELETAPFTIFIGPNNSGKSSIFQVLLCLKQSIKGPYSSGSGTLPNLIPVEGSPGSNQAVLMRKDTTKEQPFLYVGGGTVQHPNIILGAFSDVVRRGENEISVLLKGKLQLPTSLQQVVSIEIALRYQDNFLIEDQGFINLEGSDHSIPLGAHLDEIEEFDSHISWGWNRETIKLDPENLKLGELSVGLRYGYIGPSTSGWGYPGGTPTHERKTRLEKIAQAMIESPRSLVRSVHSIYPVRGMEEAGLPFPAYSASDIELAVLADRSVAIGSKLAYEKDVQRTISDWFKKIVNATIEAQPRPGYKVTLQTNDGGLLVNQGTGAQQLPFIFAPIALASPGDILLVSEPEGHLHPKAQSELAALFVEIWKKEDKQFFIETHSEHILHAFLYAIAKKELTPDQVRIYYFENDNGVAKVEIVKIDEYGRVAGGLPGFYDQHLKELSDYLHALEPDEA